MANRGATKCGSAKGVAAPCCPPTDALPCLSVCMCVCACVQAGRALARWTLAASERGGATWPPGLGASPKRRMNSHPPPAIYCVCARDSICIRLCLRIFLSSFSSPLFSCRPALSCPFPPDSVFHLCLPRLPPCQSVALLCLARSCVSLCLPSLSSTVPKCRPALVPVPASLCLPSLFVFQVSKCRPALSCPFPPVSVFHRVKVSSICSLPPGLTVSVNSAPSVRFLLYLSHPA